MNSIFRLMFLVVSTIGLTAPLPAQPPADAGNALLQQFLNPPTVTRPYVWWHWMGPNFSKEGITRDLEAMKAMGIGGATIFNLASAVQETHHPTENNPWPEQVYRGKAYWEAITHAAKEARRLGLEIGLHNTAGYSTTGGPWIDESRGMKTLVWSKIIVREGQALKPVLPKPVLPVYDGWGSSKQRATWYKDIAVMALALADTALYQNAIELTGYFDSLGTLKKPLPKGDWLIYRIGYAPTMANPHPLPDDIIGKTLEVDKMSKSENEFHWKTLLGPVKQHLGEYLGKSFSHMLIDSYEAGDQHWTPGFREAFIRMKGYDPLPWILTFNPAVCGWCKAERYNNKGGNSDYRIKGNENLTKRFEWDYRDVISTMFYENGWNTAKRELNALGLKLQMEPYWGQFNTPDGAALADLPMGEFWTFQSGQILAEVPAAARAAGKTMVGAEAFTGHPSSSQYTEDPAWLKPTANGAFASGVNRLVLHHWVHQPFDDKYQPGMGMGWWGTHFGRHQTWLKPGKAFVDYLARSQALLQFGEQVADYLCVETLQGFADLISTRSFLNQRITVTNGNIVLESGRSYPFIVFPNSVEMLPEVAEKIKVLLSEGATVVAPKPERSPSLTDYPESDRRLSAMANEVWGHGKSHKSGKGNLVSDISSAKASRAVVEDYAVVNADSAQNIKVVHRRSTGVDVYFVANLGNNPQHVVISLSVAGKQPEIWNAENGSVRNAPVWEEKQGRTSLSLNLKSFQSVFVVFRKPSITADHPVRLTVNAAADQWEFDGHTQGAPLLRAMAPLHATVDYASGKTESLQIGAPAIQEIPGPWKVNMQPKLDTAFTLDMPGLLDFSKHERPEVKYFAGSAVYNKVVYADAALLQSGKAVILDLGTLNDIVSVKINNRDAGVLWYPPYVLDVTPYVKAGENHLEITVTNNWANRLIGDEQEPADFEWGTDRGDFGRAMKAYPDWFVKNQPRPSAGRKTFSVWYYHRKDSPLQPAGLVGPVRLLYCQ